MVLAITCHIKPCTCSTIIFALSRVILASGDSSCKSFENLICQNEKLTRWWLRKLIVIDNIKLKTVYHAFAWFKIGSMPRAEDCPRLKHLSISNASNTLFWTPTRSLIGLNHCRSTLWKLNPLKLVAHTLISSNKRVSARVCWKVSIASIPLYLYLFVMENEEWQGNTAQWA